MIDGQHPFIVLEGLGGVGKTTIGKLLAEKLDGVYIKTPTESFSLMRSEIDSHAAPMARFLFYLASIAQASQEISEIVAHYPVVCDKYLLATICWHRAMGIDVQLPEFAHIRIPDYTFLLTCIEAQRIERLRQRDGSPPFSRDTEQKFLQECLQYHPIAIDNSSVDPSIAVRTILEVIGS